MYNTLAQTAQLGHAETDSALASDILNQLLSDEHVLYIKTRNYHWNVGGHHFHSLRLFFEIFFENQYDELEGMINEIAERSRSLGHYAVGSMHDFLNQARLVEHKGQGDTTDNMIKSLLNDHETLIHILRNDVVKVSNNTRDAGTSDFLNGLLEKHEKMAWMLRTHLY